MAVHHSPWTTHMVEQRRAWHAIIALVLHTHRRRRAWHAIIALRPNIQSHRAYLDIIALRYHTQLDDIRCVML